MKAEFFTILMAAAVSCSTMSMYLIREDQYCLTEDESPYVQFSTQTSYQVARNRKPVVPVPNCRAEAVWALIRHGTRFPEPEVDLRLHQLTDLAVAVVENHEKRHRGKLCPEDLDGLKRWHYKYTPADLGQLADEGKADLRTLAGGYKLSLPELFANVTPDRTTVKFTNVQRTRDSAEAFLTALNKNVDWNLSDSNEDELLMLDKNCTQWTESRDSEAAGREKKAFLDTADIKASLGRISERLGFAYELDFKTVKAMYDICRSEKAVYYQKAPVSPWCCAFEKTDLETLEYYMDLKYYYGSGYGNPVTMKLGCPLARDMLLKFDNVTKNNGTSDVNPLTLYFAHSVTLRSVITKLGLARDRTPPKHDNRGSPAVKDRQWRTSRISPFTGNLFAVLYRCTTGEEWKIMFYLNEHLVHYEGCNLGLCDWSYVIDRFRDHIDRDACNSNFCNDPNSSAGLTPTILLTMVGVFLRLMA